MIVCGSYMKKVEILTTKSPLGKSGEMVMIPNYQADAMVAAGNAKYVTTERAVKDKREQR